MSTRKRVFQVTYAGLWLGGVAIVRAASEEDAIALVGADSASVNFKNVIAVEIKGDILYNDCGDY